MKTNNGELASSVCLLNKMSGRRPVFARFSLLLLFVTLSVFPDPSLFAQSAIGSLEGMTNTKISKSSGSGMGLPSTSTVVAGALMQGLLNGLFSSDTKAKQAQIEAEQAKQAQIAQEQAKQQHIKDSLDKIDYDNLIQSSKPLPMGSANLDFKNLNGNAEQLSRAASDQFTGANGTSDIKATAGGGTEFFGTKLSDADNQILFDSENDPNVVDLRKANEQIVKNLKNDSLPIQKLLKDPVDARGGPIIEKPLCQDLKIKLKSYVDDRAKFQKTINSTQLQLKEWQDKKDEAFWSSIKDAMGLAATTFFDWVKETRSSALKIKAILDANKQRYIDQKIFTPAEIDRYYSMLNARCLNYFGGFTGTAFSDIAEYYEFMRNTMQTTFTEMGKTDTDYARLMKLFKDEGLLSDYAEVEAKQFIARKLIDKFLNNPSITKGCMKISWVGLLQLGVDEAFNAADYLTSYYRICKLNDVTGDETRAAQYIQQKINDTRDQLTNCK